MSGECVVKMEKINKSFYGVQVLYDVDFTLNAGEVRGLLGENGAGKSTLMKILNGIYTANSGKIYIHGQEKNIRIPDDARKEKISFIHQEISLATNLTIAQNMFLGIEKRKKRFFVDDPTMLQEAQRMLDALDLKLRADTIVSTLSIAQQQLVEIAKALVQDAEVIVMDEPTATLSEKEVEYLFKQIKRLKQQNVAIVYISHRMDEIFQIADSVTVLRDGRLIGTRPIEGLTRHDIISMMVGREITEMYINEKAQGKEVLFAVKELTTSRVKDISFELKKGEILGFAGLVGAGRTELMNAIFGIDKVEKGEMYLEGKQIFNRIPAESIKNGIGFASEDRKQNGLVLIKDVGYNITLPVVREFIRGIRVNRKKESTIIGTYSKSLSIKMSGVEQLCQYLSGGNQQKVVISKWLATHAKILILDEPTRGIDVGAKSEIYHLMKRLADEGISIIMVSSELPEIINISSRIVVMHEGRISGILSEDEIASCRSDELQKVIMHYATGGK